MVRPYHIDMNDKQSDLQTISIFASSTRLSVKALRLYDQLDILKPAYIDPSSGYRYYHVEQIHTARLIRMMRLMDMPLALIRQVLDVSPDEAEQLILAYLDELQAKLERAGHVVQTLIHTIKGETQPMAFEVNVKTVEAQPIISLTYHVKVDQLDKSIRDGVKKLHEVASAKGATVGVPFGIYHGHIDHESDGPIEVCLPTATLLTDVEDGIQAREVLGGKVVYVNLHGKECFFPNILKGYDTLTDWMRQNGYEHVNAPHEIWHSISEPEHLEITWAFQEQNS